MKRPLSPTTAQEAAERARRIAKLAYDSSNQNFRTRTRIEHEEKRDEGRFFSARKTYPTLDEKAGIEVSYSYHYPAIVGHRGIFFYNCGVCSLMS